MSFELSEDHETFRKVVRDFAEGEIAPHVAAVGPGAPLPGRRRAQDGRARAVRAGRPRGVRRRTAATSPSLCVAIEELGRVDQSIGITLSAGVGLGINPILTFGTDEQKQRLAARPGRRPRAGRVRPDRARGRLGRRRHPHPRRRCDERRVGHQRRQGVHHQLRHADHLGRHGHRPHRTGRRRDLDDHGARPARPGFIVEPAYDKLGWHASDTHGLTFDDCRVPEDEPARRARPRASSSSSPSSTTAGSRSRRWRSAWPRPAWTLPADYAKTGTPSARRSGRDQGGRVPARRPRRRRSRRPGC